MMPQPFMVVAIDYDGTIAYHDVPDAAALEAIDSLRSRGVRVLLCTGRVLDDLRSVFPEVDRHFDALIVENGGVIVISSVESCLVEPMAAELTAALEEARIPIRVGRVLLATDATHDELALSEIERLGLEAQLVYNRGALMILPAGVSKGSGLLHALGRMEFSRHNTIGIGDAENDHSLLHACEIGVAAGNAVPGLRAHADLCLAEPNGAGVAAFLNGPVLNNEVHVHPDRWHVSVGVSDTGDVVRLPGSRINVVVAGASCTGKSHFAGMLVERLAELDYTVCVLDAEGDHAVLGRLPGIISVGGGGPLPSPSMLAATVQNRFSSVIVDLSSLGAEQKRKYCREALVALHALRQTRGFPHWIFIEEADQLLANSGLPVSLEPTPHGYCYVTHRPAALDNDILSSLDAIVALPGAERYARILFSTSETVPDQEQPFRLQSGEALLARHDRLLTFEVASRSSPHVRHQHKYMYAQVPADRRFYFGPHDGGRRAAGNLVEFGNELGRIPLDALRAHLLAGDFSRWTRDVLADDELGARLRGVERWFRADPDADGEAARSAVRAAIQERYSGIGEEATPSSPVSNGEGKAKTEA